MIKIGITQRVIFTQNQSIDSLDSEWPLFLKKCNINFELIPNNFSVISEQYLDRFQGMIFTGGNSLVSCGGDASIRDLVEKKIFRWAHKKNVPILGVCRGMQIIQEEYGLKLKRIYGHVKQKQTIKVNNILYKTNSYHNFGTKKTCMNLKVFAKSNDGIIKGIGSINKKILAIMWHPERMNPSNSHDLNLFKKFFKIL